MAVRWSDNATSLILESLQSRESLWNSRNISYKNRDTRKKEYDEIIDILKEDMPGVDLKAVKAKIQSLRTTFHEEIRKVKKSQSTGSGCGDVYVPKWKFFEESLFLEDVITSNRPSFSNISSEASSSGNLSEDLEEDDSSSLSVTPSPGDFPKRQKNKTIPWTEKAPSALSGIAKGSAEHSDEDECEIFGKDVANSLRSLQTFELQRRAKFAVQTAIFQAAFPQPMQQATAPFNQMPGYPNISGYQNNSNEHYHAGF